MATLVGKTFPDITVKAIDEIGDSFMINVLDQALENKRKSFFFGTQRILRLFVQQKYMPFKKLQEN